MFTLTSDEAKAARVALGISQARAAGLADISRTYLSQFENGRLVLPDEQLRRLRSLYERQGHNFGDRATPDPDVVADDFDPLIGDSLTSLQCRFVDGFAVPAAVEDDEADAILSEYTENSARVRELCAQPAGFFDWDAEDQKREAISLMVRNFALVESMQGRDSVLGDKDHESDTVGGMIRTELAQYVPDSLDAEASAA